MFQGKKLKLQAPLNFQNELLSDKSDGKLAVFTYF